MPFCSTDLAARIERAEARLVTDGAAALPLRLPDVDIYQRPIAGGVVLHTIEGSPLNKLVGLGFDGPVDEGELEEIERAFAARNAPLQVELSTLADPSIAPLLTRRGYVLMGFENVLGRPLPVDGLPPVATGVEVEISRPEEMAEWVDLVVTGFMAPDTQGVASHESYPREILDEIIGDMAASEGFVRYTARADSIPVGGASMRTFEGVAQLCGAATLPEHRRRGVQTALLAARLRLAADAGCDIAVVTTQPGSKSCENVQRQGFEVLYPRAVLVRDT